MERGAGGHGPTDGDEPVEGGRAAPSDDREFGGGQADDADTDSVEILDDGADWLADQLAALPQDTSDIPIVSAAEAPTDRSDVSEESAGSSGWPGTHSTDADAVDATDADATDADATDEMGESGPADDAPATHRIPVVADDTATPPRGAVSSQEAAAPEPSLTKPRPIEPVAGWFAPSPPRPPLPVRAAEEDGSAADAAVTADTADVSHAADASGVSDSPADAVAPADTADDSEVPSASVASDRDEDTDDDPDLQGADDVDTAAAPQPVSSRPVSAHPNAIVIPGLPKRAPAGEDESTTDAPEATSARATGPGATGPGATGADATGPDVTGPEARSADAPSHAAPSSEAPSSREPVPFPGVPDETGDIDFGSFAWSLVANDEDDPRLVRERREAAERAAAAAEAEATRRAAAASAAAAAATAAPARASDGTAPDADADVDADADRADADADADADATNDRRTAEAGRDESATPTVITPAVPAAGPEDASDGSDHAGARSADAPTWSRPDLDDSFPATAAMDVLPDDDDPDDPDDELGAADRFSALGTAAMPVSAASAAIGEADHVPTPASVGRADPSESVFPGGFVSDGDGSPLARRSVRSSGETPPPAGTTPARPSTTGGRSSLPVIAAAVVIVLALAGLFYLGTRIPLIFGGSTDAAASASPTPTPSAEPTAEQPAAGPLAPGTYAWDELQGGECLDPYSSPWAEEFTVVDCAQPHAAQLLVTAPYSDDPAAPFPGADVIASEIGLLCSAPGVVDFAAAAPFTDLQVQGAYPVSGEQWTAGDRDYFCFASRSSGEPLTATVASTP